MPSAAGPPWLLDVSILHTSKICTAVFILCYWLHGCDGWLADYWQLKFDMPKALIWDAWTLLFSIFWHPGAPFWWSGKARGSTEDILGSRSRFFMFLIGFWWSPGIQFFRYFCPVSWFRGLNLRPEVVGCFLSDLGMNTLPKYDGRMWRKPSKYRCFLKFQTFDLFSILGSSGTAWDLILAAFRVSGAAF